MFPERCTEHVSLFISRLCFGCRSDRLLEHVSIALVGKYTKFTDSYASVIKALEHSALAINHKLEVKVWSPVTLERMIFLLGYGCLFSDPSYEEEARYLDARF